MGIRSLESYIDKECPQALVTVNIPESAALYRSKTKKVPVLLIDGSSCSNHLYDSIHSTGLHLGLFAEFEEQLLLLVRLLTNNGIKPIFFFDGSPPEKREGLWVQRRNMQCDRIIEATNFLRNGQTRQAQEVMQQEVAKTDFMKYSLRFTDCEIMQTVKEADDEIMEFIAKNGCFGILARDTDYIACEGVENYFSVKDLNVSTLAAKGYCRKSLAIHLGIDESFLPLFATLCGNDIMQDEDLRSFHLQLLRDLPNYYRLQSARHLPKKVIIPKVGTWISRNSSRLTKEPSASGVIAQLIQNPSLKEKISDSIKSYLLPKVQDYREPMSANLSEKWSEIVRLAEERHRRQCLYTSILAVMTRSKCYQGCRFELYFDPSLPPSGSLLKDLRRRLYGILLYERPSTVGPAYVTEFVVNGPNTLIPPQKVAPDFPVEHPGLLYLWGDCALVDQVKLLCWAVSPKLKVGNILKITDSLRVASLALFYIIHEAKTGLVRWQVEALVIHLIRLMRLSLKDLNAMKCVPTDTDMIEIHIGSLYIRTWFHVLAAHDACGSPFLNGRNAGKNFFFNGKLFNTIYKSMKSGVQGSKICDASMMNEYNQVIDFLY